MDTAAEKVFRCKLENVVGKPLQTILPNVNLPKEATHEAVRHKTVGTTIDGRKFPVETKFEETLQSDSVFDVTVLVYSNLSGLVILTAEGLIETCNANFINGRLGYSSMDLQGKSI